MSDTDVLLVLIHLTNVRNAFKSKQVEFSRYELVKFLGWDLGGRSYVRLDESLRRWTSVTLHFKHSWCQRKCTRWRSRSFHVMESLCLRGRDEMGDDGLSAFTWSDVIFDSFAAGNLRRINLDTYFRLDSAIAKQIFRFVGKRFHRSQRLTFSLREFACERIGLSRAYDAYDLKRKLQPAIEELESIGFLAPLPYADRYAKLAPGKWNIILQASQQRPSAEVAANGTVRQLTQRGVSQPAAENLAAAFPAAHIADKVALHDRLVQQRDRRISRNPAGFLASTIRHDFRMTLSDARPPRPTATLESPTAALQPTELSPSASIRLTLD